MKYEFKKINGVVTFYRDGVTVSIYEIMRDLNQIHNLKDVANRFIHYFDDDNNDKANDIITEAKKFI